MNTQDVVQIPKVVTASDALMGLYDCFQDPGKVTHLMDILGAWLDEDGVELQLGEFEAHSQRLWDLLSQHLGAEDVTTLQEAVAPNAEGAGRTYLDRSLRILETGSEASLSDRMRASDVGRYKDWISSGQALPLIVRLYETGVGERSDDTAGPALVILMPIETRGAQDPPSAVCYFETTEVSLGETMEAMFQSSFSFTQAEMRVLRRLVMGENGAQIADTLGRGRETVKSQIKSICTKLGVPNQNSVLAAVRLVERQVAGAKLPQQGSLTPDLLTLPGGSKIAYRTYGPDRGRPLFLVHGLLTGRHLPKAVVAPLEAADVRLIVPARPGYGQSTLDTFDPATTLQQTVVNMSCLAQALNYSRISLITDGAALLFALEFSRRFPGLCGPIMALDPCPPLLSDGDLDAFRGRFRNATVTNFRSKGALETLFRLTYLDAKEAKTPEDLPKHHAFRQLAMHKGETDSDDLAARWENLQENISSEFKHLTQETELFKTDFLHFAPGSNLRPSVHVFRTDDNIYLTPEASAKVADRLSAPLTDVGPALPHISGQLGMILRELSFAP